MLAQSYTRRVLGSTVLLLAVIGAVTGLTDSVEVYRKAPTSNL